MKRITFSTTDTTYAVELGAAIEQILADVGNLLRDQIQHGIESTDFRDQAIQLCETARERVARVDDGQDNADGESISFTALGSNPLHDWRFSAVVGDELRALLAAIAGLVAARDTSGDKSEEFVMQAIGVCVYGASALTPLS